MLRTIQMALPFRTAFHLSIGEVHITSTCVKADHNFDISQPFSTLLALAHPKKWPKSHAWFTLSVTPQTELPDEMSYLGMLKDQGTAWTPLASSMPWCELVHSSNLKMYHWKCLLVHQIDIINAGGDSKVRLACQDARFSCFGVYVG
jgi:hypothetical protein